MVDVIKRKMCILAVAIIAVAVGCNAGQPAESSAKPTEESSSTTSQEPQSAQEITPSPSSRPVPQRLTWAPPKLTEPVTIQVANENSHLKLDPKKDYILKMPTTPLTSKGGLTITGGHNVVLIGGEIRMDIPSAEKESPLGRRGVYINQSTGTVHIEGLYITGKHLAEGFNIDLRSPGAICQLQNIRVDTVHGSREGHHADVVQTWGGPSQLRIDRLTGSTTYQGFFLHPTQFLKDRKPTLFDLRNINLNGLAYLLWQATPFPIHVQNVYVNPTRPEAITEWPLLTLWPKNDPVWKDVKQGTPPGGDFVPAESVGVNYRSPGYLSTPQTQPVSAK